MEPSVAAPPDAENKPPAALPTEKQPLPKSQPPATHDATSEKSKTPATVSLTGTWKNTGGVQVKITDDGKSIKLQVGETPTLVSLNGSLTRTKNDVFEGTVQIIPKADRKRTPLNIPVRATLLNPDELHLVYAHWPTFNRKGIRQIEDTKADDSIKRISSR